MEGKESVASQLFEYIAKAYRQTVAMRGNYGKTSQGHPSGTGKNYIVFILTNSHPDGQILVHIPNAEGQLESLRNPKH